MKDRCMHKVTFIPGDGIGPEVSLAAKRCISAVGVKISWEEVLAGEEAIDKHNTPLPSSVLESIKKNKVALKGPITTPVGEGFRSVNVALRQTLGLYANLRPCRYYPGVKSYYKDVDLIIVRENSEDLYAGIEFKKGDGKTEDLISTISSLTSFKIPLDSGISIKPISFTASAKIVRFAFEYALKYKRKKVTCVHKANIMKFSDGLFLEAARQVAGEYSGRVEFEDKLVDNMCMQLVQKPENYDLLVLPNLYGDIISDLCAGLVGGLGVAPSANIGEEFAIFEPTHGSAPKYKGLNKVNPTAMILSAVLMLRHLGEEEAANKLEKAVAKVIAEGKTVTYDLKANPDDPTAAKCSEMTEEIIRKIAS